MRHILIWMIQIYQNTLSLILPSSCRFYPSCSQYTKEAILKYGMLMGSWLGICRIIKCQPFYSGGSEEFVK